MILSRTIHYKNGELLANVNYKNVDLLTEMFTVEILQRLAKWHSEGGLYFIGNEAEALFKQMLVAKGIIK